jgi:hypothetical protein
MTETLHHARCACGAVHLEAPGKPARSMLCSCADCRRKTGSAYNWSLYWPEAAIVVAGATRSFSRPAQGGRSIEMHLCPICGTSLWWRLDAFPGEIGVGGGVFDTDDLPPPTVAYWVEGRPDWAVDLAPIPARVRQ